MYLPLADDIGSAFDYAVNALAKRSTGGDIEPFTISHVSADRRNCSATGELMGIPISQTQWVTIYWIEGMCGGAQLVSTFLQAK